MILSVWAGKCGAGVGEKYLQLHGLANGDLGPYVLWLPEFWKRTLLYQEVGQARLFPISVEKPRKRKREPQEEELGLTTSNDIISTPQGDLHRGLGNL